MRKFIFSKIPHYFSLRLTFTRLIFMVSSGFLNFCLFLWHAIPESIICVVHIEFVLCISKLCVVYTKTVLSKQNLCCVMCNKHFVHIKHFLCVVYCKKAFVHIKKYVYIKSRRQFRATFTQGQSKISSHALLTLWFGQYSIERFTCSLKR